LPFEDHAVTTAAPFEGPLRTKYRDVAVKDLPGSESLDSRRPGAGRNAQLPAVDRTHTEALRDPATAILIQVGSLQHFPHARPLLGGEDLTAQRHRPAAVGQRDRPPAWSRDSAG